MATRNKKVSIATRMSEHPGVKSTVDGHCNSKAHIKNKRIYENKEQSKKQTTLSTIKISSESKREVIEDLIKAFFSANIPLEKVNK
ncbi:12246_t:CDS:2 [Gigaspora margarita]|uniref:12246_t:CDS:1 n=1 Tax=Gigaspora margarita TaxID=4874 RepID=A0ABN7VK57_GIGMA|nr:12246_t:CDS:2 [Gigaspora margarita]